MPSLRHSSAMLSSPRRPAITIRIFSSVEYCRRVARRISRTRFSAASESVSTFDLIVRSFAAKMSPKPSLPQSLHSVQLVLTGNSELPLKATELREGNGYPEIDGGLLRDRRKLAIDRPLSRDIKIQWW